MELLCTVSIRDTKIKKERGDLEWQNKLAKTEVLLLQV